MWAAASIGQPFATVVKLATGASTLCIFTVSHVVDRAAGAAQVLRGIRVRLRTAADGDASPDNLCASSTVSGASVEDAEVGEYYDARKAWSWDGGRTHGSKEAKFAATIALPFNPGFNKTMDKVMFTLDSLRAVLSTLEMIMDKPPTPSPTL